MPLSPSCTSALQNLFGYSQLAFREDDGDQGSYFPQHYDDDNLYMDLQGGQWVGTLPPDTGLCSPPGSSPVESASFAMVMRRAAEVLDLQLGTMEVKTNTLTEVLQPGPTSSESLLPFNEALTDTFVGT